MIKGITLYFTQMRGGVIFDVFCRKFTFGRRKGKSRVASVQHGLAGANGYSGLTKTSTALPRLSSKRTIL
ncbi:hypothetical protein COI02_09335 [Neisseria meningitidis]|nr:hypothetical protein COH83_06385 [Neisseria meningitidis]RQJ93163.1 hypothetical protein COI02_09335 [Neisseria meningitidis]RQK12803.1 hypothetical protein COH80_08035 [Neisseria meningitidis]RQK36433.1 hypothetical protein COH72_11165 [Neisseria meningitidis]RQK42350.1 hypothetical protein COH71_07915 [Neisseria meningitidis]